MDSANTLPVAPADERPPVITSPVQEAGDAAFLRDLPELQKAHRHWWVAYLGERRVALAKTHAEVSRICATADVPWHDLVIWCVEAPPECVYLGLGSGHLS